MLLANYVRASLHRSTGYVCPPPSSWPALQCCPSGDAIEEERLHAFKKLVKWRVFRKGESVLVLRRPIVVTHKTRGKFEPKWEGPYAIKQAYDGGAYQLVDP